MYFFAWSGNDSDYNMTFSDKMTKNALITNETASL